MQRQLEKRWFIPDPLPSEVEHELRDFQPYLRQILYNRNVHTADEAVQYLNCSAALGDPFLLKDMDISVTRLWQAIERVEPIAVYGDYDVDGVSATALMVQVLRALGGNAEAYIPNRFDEGYGLNNEALDTLAGRGIRVVLTVDCGIRSPREAEHARELGVDLIISDHHMPQNELPRALAVICQKREGDEYPDKNLAGVGLAYKIAQGLLQSHPVEGVKAVDWLDLVALGTVADVVPLTGENRVMVRLGLQCMRLAQRQGLLSLAQAAGINLRRVNAGDIGYRLGPRLNAAGRLESALQAYQLLVTDDIQQAGMLAQKLDDQNKDRQRLTQEMQTRAEELLSSVDDGKILIACDSSFNSGVVGLVAAKLTETYYRPAVVGQIGDEFTRASCRSIREFHITKALDECADLLVRHGGHAAAAGFTVRNEAMPELSRRLDEIARRELAEQDLRPMLRADVEIPLALMRPSYLEEIERLQPTGMQNPDAVFVSRNLQVVNARTVGSEAAHLRLTVKDGGVTYNAIAFRQGHWAGHLPPYIDLMYTYEMNSFNGRDSMQLNVIDLKPSGI
ncbi:exonuclease RecJ [Longilinea arvoryzae]|uniref:Single-stranded-DNA-specific exonuclease RecJ n=1 Tax=Longilinea arvoryzae TaxID=360412 RepID=A0A0S7BGQ8_9CHLR|nr:single-stranded-DNA-specific exonuclease RecJ [Longilinea arvoryzae]GAP14228.1 exonuclease RecJ [Longilinea arvoryzae]